MFFYFDVSVRKFFGIPLAEVAVILGLIGTVDDGVTSDSSERVSADFSTVQLVVSCGLVWDHNFLETLFILKKSAGFLVAQIIYDVIPVLMPEYCAPGMERLFPKFLIDAAWTADFVYAISSSTLRDLDRYLQQSGAPIPSLNLVELGADVPLRNGGELSEAEPSLVPGHFILYVSSIEPRKNHQMLFNIWRTFADEPDGIDIPTLVLVGKPAWNTEDLVRMMQMCPRIYPSKLRILESITDTQLAWLYSNCRFTVYPSLYEGWGLPVRESLIYGKVCISSANSGTAEAGGGFTWLVAPLDFKAWMDAIRCLITDDAVLRQREAAIKAKFRPLTWSDAARDFRANLMRAVAERLAAQPRLQAP